MLGAKLGGLWMLGAKLDGLDVKCKAGWSGC